MKKIITIVGARPQFIKCAPVTKELEKRFKHMLVHTGQHYDNNMSEIFFKQLCISKPDYDLKVGSSSHGKQTGRMLSMVEQVLIDEEPDGLVVYGDTNSTLAGALAASKLLIPVFHIEAGLRSFNKNMPEEQNRILTDHLSSLLFCPTDVAVSNLKKENIMSGVYKTGDVMYDATILALNDIDKNSNVLNALSLKKKDYYLSTVHRAENTNNIQRLRAIFETFTEIGKKIVLPLHPRTKKIIENSEIIVSNNVMIIEPVGYFDMINLQKNAIKILTDSGGMQKEAYFVKTPCIVLRDETEWTELIDLGVNKLVGANKDKIIDTVKDDNDFCYNSQIYGDGQASRYISDYIYNFLL